MCNGAICDNIDLTCFFMMNMWDSLKIASWMWIVSAKRKLHVLLKINKLSKRHCALASILRSVKSDD